jgi:hypothetical protein
VPVGVAPEPVTVAMNFTAWPKTDGFWLEVRVVVLGVPPAGLTLWLVVPVNRERRGEKIRFGKERDEGLRRFSRGGPAPRPPRP